MANFEIRSWAPDGANLISCSTLLWFRVSGLMWARAEKTLSQRYCGNGTKIRKASSDSCGYDLRTTRPVARGCIRGKYPPKFFVSPTLCCAQKNSFWAYNKHKNISPLKMYFAPPNRKTWLRACAQFTRTEKVAVHEKYDVLMNHS